MWFMTIFSVWVMTEPQGAQNDGIAVIAIWASGEGWYIYPVVTKQMDAQTLKNMAQRRLHQRQNLN
jgi:hypothetical protein